MPLVLTILEFLHNNSGLITLQQLDDKTTAVKLMTYDPSQPIDIIFNSIDNLVEYAGEDKAELNQSQTINLALIILHRQQIFKDNIRAWKHTNPEYKTWDNFKHAFQEAHLELRETGGTIDELGFHRANVILDQMIARLKNDEEKRTSTATQHATDVTSTNQANGTMETKMQNLLSQVQDLQLAITHGKQTNHRNNFVRRHGHSYGRGRSASRGTGRRRG